MAIRTFPTQEIYSRNRGGGTEPKKLRKLRSVKVANLDRMRLSMKREQYRFDRDLTSSDYSTDPSESSSTTLSGGSSPHYMKATSSSSARKGSLQASSGTAAKEKSTSKFYKVAVQKCSDSAGISIPVHIRSANRLKRVPSLKTSKKLSSKKSMQIRTRFSQFPEMDINDPEPESLTIEEMESLGLIDSTSYNEGSIVKGEVQQKGTLGRLKSIRLTRVRSIKSSTRRPKSRLGGGAMVQLAVDSESSNATLHNMKATSSHEAQKKFAKTLTRTTTLRPLRILAKIPSLRNRRSKVRKRPEVTSSLGANVNRATCSSTLRTCKFPHEIEVPSNETSSFHVCSYSYCSLHGHHHRTASPQIKEFISAKRQLNNNSKRAKQHDKQTVERVDHYTSAPQSDNSIHVVSADSDKFQSVNDYNSGDAVVGNDTDLHNELYIKPRKKWVIEGTPGHDTEELNGSVQLTAYTEDCDGKTEETTTKVFLEATQAALNKEQPESSEITIESDDLPDAISQQQPKKTLESSDKGLEGFEGEEILSSHKSSSKFASKEPDDSPEGGLINLLSDKRKYTSIWHLIHQQFAPSEESMEQKLGVDPVVERGKGEDANTSQEMSKSDLGEETLEFNQTAAVKLVQEALNGVLLRYTQSSDDSAVTDMSCHPTEAPCITPATLTEESLEPENKLGGDTSLASEDKQITMGKVLSALQQKQEPIEKIMPARKFSGTFSKLKKLITTAKFIKAMERLKKINPRKPSYLSSEPMSEEERVYLRHLSMSERRNVEEWMLDHALRQAISRLAPDQQRRVTLLVEAFETVNPDQKEKVIKRNPMKSKSDPVIAVKDEELKQDGEPEQEIRTTDEQDLEIKDGVLLYQNTVPEGTSLGEVNSVLVSVNRAIEGPSNADKTQLHESPFQTHHLINERGGAPGVKILTDHNESETVGQIIKLSTVNKENKDNPSGYQAGNSPISPTGETRSLLLDKHMYNSMWNLIYHQTMSSQASAGAKRGASGVDEDEQGDDSNNCQRENDLEPIQDICNNQDDPNQSTAWGKSDIDQSAAIKFVKEAIEGILKTYEQPSDQTSIVGCDEATNVTQLCIRTTENSGEGNISDNSMTVQKHEHSEPTPKQDQAETTDQLQHQVEHKELTKPPRKMSKSYSRLKKAFMTAKFIKAMEKLRNSSPRKSSMDAEAAPQEENVNLRHISITGKKNEEEWMLDYALRQVISKLDPEQKRRVTSLVEAFERVTPECKSKGIRDYPLKGEPAPNVRAAILTNQEPEELVEFEQKRSTTDEQVADEVKIANTYTHEQTRQPGVQDPQKSHTDDNTQQNTEVVAVDENSSGSNTVKAVDENQSMVYEDIECTYKVPLQPAPGDTAVADVDMTILSDKLKYSSMWHLIYQQVITSEASQDENGEDKGEEELVQSHDANNQEMNDLNPTHSSHSLNNIKDKRNAACETDQFDQTAAIKLVKEAINALLQQHEQPSDQQSSPDNNEATANATASLKSTQENCDVNRTERQIKMNSDDKLQTDNGNPLMQVEPNEAMTAKRKFSKSFIKLRKLIATTKFIKAMERMRRISVQKPGHLTPEAPSEDEVISLKHQKVNERRNDEEWMLNYALRKVISGLDPDQQKRVAKLVNAYETVILEQKDGGIKCQKKAEPDQAPDSTKKDEGKHIVNNGQDNVTSYESPIHQEQNEDAASKLAEGAALQRTLQEDISVKTSKSCGGHLYFLSEASPKVDPVTVRKEDTDSNLSSESTQQACSSEESDTEKGMLSEKHKHTTMWHLIYQHMNLVTAVESGTELGERVVSNTQSTCDSAPSGEIADSGDGDSDTSSVVSELSENEAIKIVKEAINGILDTPQEIDSEVLSIQQKAVSEEDQRAAPEETSVNSLPRGYSKLKQLIICNKFIRAMEKKPKIHPHQQKIIVVEGGREVEQAHLKTRAGGEKKRTDDLLLDNALQKVISELAPVQRKRVALLVEAFENVNVKLEDTGKGCSGIRNESSKGISSVGSAKKKEHPTFVSSQSSDRLPAAADLKLNESAESSGRYEVLDKESQQTKRCNIPSQREEKLLDEKDGRTDGSSISVAMTSDTSITLSDTCNDQKEAKSIELPGSSPSDARGLEDENLGFPGLGTESARNTSEHEEQNEGVKASTENNLSLDGEKYSNLWCLLVQHVKSDVLEKLDEQETSPMDANSELQNQQVLSQSISDDAHHLLLEPNHDKGMDVQTPNSSSFEFQEKEAIKLVQEAIDEMLLVPDQTSDDQTTDTSTSSDQKDTARSDQVENASPKDDSSNSYRKLSNVIMCKRFIKAMDKMRKLKPIGPPQIPQQQAESTPTMRPVGNFDKKSWEEWMLDHAMQQVVGELAPAKKKKVALLVQAFETVASQPEPSTSLRVKLAAS